VRDINQIGTLQNVFKRGKYFIIIYITIFLLGK